MSVRVSVCPPVFRTFLLHTLTYWAEILHMTLFWCTVPIIYIYCPVGRETRRFVAPRKFMSPEGEARGRHEFSGCDKSSCLPTNWAINCLLYREAVARRYTAQCVVPWDTTGKHDVWRETRRFVLPPRDFSRPIIFLYSSYQLYEV